MKEKKGALLIVFVIVFIDLVGFGMIIPLSSYLSKRFAATPFENGLLMSSFSIMQFLFAPFWGSLSDRFGRRPILLMSVLFSGLSYLGFAYATTYGSLLLWRCLAGVFAANISTAMAYISDVTTEENRSKGMGLVGAAFGLGFMFGPFLGGFFGSMGQEISPLPPFGMNFSALIAAGICFVNFLFALKILKESLPKDRRAQIKKRESRILKLVGSIKKPVLGQLLLVTFLSTFAMAHMESTVFYLVIERFGWSLKFSSYGFAYIGLIMVITQGYLVRKLLPKFGERRLLLVGFALSSMGMLGIAFTWNVWSMAVTQTFLALGIGLVSPSLNGSISLVADQNAQGHIMGVNQSMSAMGRILGPLLGGFIYGNISQNSPYFFACSIMAICCLICISLYKKLPQHTASPKGVTH